MTNLDSRLKSRDPVVMYGCESWTVKKAECQQIDAFELWCWRRLLGVPWTARMSTESVMNQASSLDLGGLCCLGPHEGRCSGSHGLEHVRACLLAFSGRPEGSPVFQMRKLEEQGRDRLRQGLKARPRLWEEGVMAPLSMVFLNTWACLSSPGQALRGSRVAPAAKGDHMHAGLSEVTKTMGFSRQKYWSGVPKSL